MQRSTSDQGSGLMIPSYYDKLDCVVVGGTVVQVSTFCVHVNSEK